MDGKKIDQLWHEAPEDREPPPGRGVRGVLAPALVARPFSSRHVLIIRRFLWLMLTVPVNCFSSLCELAELLIECKKFSTVTVLLSCVLKPAGHCFGLGLDFTDAVLVPLLIYVRSYCKCQKQHLWTRRLFTHNTSDGPGYWNVDTHTVKIHMSSCVVFAT